MTSHKTNWSRAGGMLIGALVAGFVLPGTALAVERYALVIANKDYRHTAPVQYADRDADAIETALKNVWGVKRRNIRRENNVTSSDLRFLFGTRETGGSLRSLVQGGDSELIVYYAGHGSKSRGTPYLLGVDTRPSQLEVTGYSLDLLLERLANFQKKHLPKGRVTVILESCFSGRSSAGELVSGTSAPAFGAPVVLSGRMLNRPERFVVMAAAKGDQFAVWDTEYKQSVFTDALVSALHGEADQATFGGNADGKVTYGEMKRFVAARIARRLRAVRPGSSQQPEVIGGADRATLVEVASISGNWTELFRRSHGEKLRATLILSNPTVTSIDKYLSTCLYCEKRDDLLKSRSDIERKSVSCEIEAPILDQLVANGTGQEIMSFKATCLCCNRVNELNRRLASVAPGLLPDNPPVPTVDDATDVATTTPVPAETGVVNDGNLTRVLQQELKRVGCYAGYVDGQWGAGSKRALKRFARAANVPVTRNYPNAANLRLTRAQPGQVCNSNCRSGQVERDGKCVARSCASGYRLTTRGGCVRGASRSTKRRTTTN